MKQWDNEVLNSGIFFILFVLALPCGLWDLISLSRDCLEQTQDGFIPCTVLPGVFGLPLVLWKLGFWAFLHHFHLHAAWGTQDMANCQWWLLTSLPHPLKLHSIHRLLFNLEKGKEHPEYTYVSLTNETKPIGPPETSASVPVLISSSRGLIMTQHCSW